MDSQTGNFLQIFIDMQSSDQQIRRIGISNLAQINDINAVDILINTLNDDDPEVRFGAERALVNIGFQAVPMLIASLEKNNDKARFYVVRALSLIRDPRSINHLILALSDSDEQTRLYAAFGLGEIGSKKSVQSLIRATHDPSLSVVSNALRALGRIGGATATKAIISAYVNNKSPSAALLAMGYLHDDATFSILIEALYNFDSNIREVGIDSLTKRGDKRATQHIFQMLQDVNTQVRYAAIWAMYELGDYSTLNQLQWIEENDSAETYDNHSLKEAAREVINHILNR